MNQPSEAAELKFHAWGPSGATHKMYTSVKAYSHRQGVDVVIGSQAYEYGRPKRGVRVDDHVESVVADAVADYSEGRYQPEAGWDILRSTATINRGEHTFTVWRPKER